MSRHLVLDASAAIRLVLKTNGWQTIENELREATTVLVPSLFFAETANALWKHVRAGDLSEDEAQGSYEVLCALVDRPVRSEESASREALREAVKHEHPVYDLLYATLARQYGCGVVTWDRRLRSLLAKMEVEVLPSEGP